MPSVDVGIIQSVLHPPVGFLTPHLDGAGPHTGNITLTTFSSTLGPIFTPSPIKDTSGIIAQVASTIPEGWGRELGWTDPVTGGGEDYYHNRFAQVVVQHQLRMPGDLLVNTGPWMTTQLVEIHSFPVMVLWDVATPGRIGLMTAPGVEIDLYFLLILDS